MCIFLASGSTDNLNVLGNFSETSSLAVDEYILFCRYYGSIKAILLLLSASFPCPLSLFILSAPILVTDKRC